MSATAISNENNEDDVSYCFELTLKENVKFKLNFGEGQSQRATYFYQLHQKLDRRTPLLTVKQYAYINYDHGRITDKLNLTYEIINHQNKGVKFFAGVDISENSQVFLDIVYQYNQHGYYVIHTIHKGINCIYDASEPEQENALMQAIESPLNIMTVIEPKYGSISVPLCLTDDEKEVFIEIPLSVVR